MLALGEELDADPVPLLIVIGDGWVLTRHDEPIAYLEQHREAIQDQREVGRLAPVEFSGLGPRLARGSVLPRRRAARARGGRARRRCAQHGARHPGSAGGDAPAYRAGATRDRGAQRGCGRDIAARLHAGERAPRLEALNAVGKRLARAADAVSNAREMLIGTFDVHMTRTAQRTNETMRLLTLASVILLRRSCWRASWDELQGGAVRGPEPVWVVIWVMLAMAAATLAVARWRGWL